MSRADMSRDLPPGSSSREPSFDEPWEAEAFALTIAAHRNSIFAWDDWVRVFASRNRAETLEAAASLNAAYYRNWLAALEALLIERGALTAREVETRTAQWRRAYLRTPHGQPIDLATGFGGAEDEELGFGSAHHHHYHEHEHHHDHAGRCSLDADRRHVSRDPRVPVFVSPALKS